MRSLKATGLMLALGLLAARSVAEELQWRAGTPIKADAAPAASADPWNSARTPSSPPQVTTLSKPVPLTNVSPVDYRGAVPLVRATMADNVQDVKVMPLGTPSKIEGFHTGVGEKQKTEEIIPVNPKEITPSPMMSGGSTSWFSGPIMGEDCCCGCSQDCCGCMNECGCCCRDRGCCWFSAEYLLWNVSRQNMPTLLATFPRGTSERDIMNGNALGARTLIDGNNLPGDTRSGGRFTAGFWIPGCEDFGLEASYFFLGTRNSLASFNSPNGMPILAIPFIDDATGRQRNFITAHPGPPVAVSGSFAMNASSYLWGVEMNLRQKLCCGPSYHLDLLYGYRHIQLQDSIEIVDVESPAGGQAVQIWEKFATRNQFNGGQIGIDGEWHFLPRLFVGGQFKLALGNVTQTVTINGVATPAVGGGNSNLALHAQDNNIGKFARNTFAVAPEMALKLGFDVTDRLSVWVGYDVLFLSSVIRAGEQIDTTFTFPNGQGPRPAVLFNTTSFVGQGFNVGVRYVF